MDEGLRRLQRAAASGDPAARLGLLRGALQQGRWSHEELRLAAFLGDPLACELAELEAPAGARLEEWTEGLLAFGRAPLVQLALLALPALRRGEELPVEETRPQAAWQAAEAWLRDPREATRVHAQQAAEECRSWGELMTSALLEFPEEVEFEDVVFAVEAYAWAASCAGALREVDALHALRQTLRGAAGLFPARDSLPSDPAQQRAWLRPRLLRRLGLELI